MDQNGQFFIFKFAAVSLPWNLSIVPHRYSLWSRWRPLPKQPLERGTSLLLCLTQGNSWTSQNRVSVDIVPRCEANQLCVRKNLLKKKRCERQIRNVGALLTLFFFVDIFIRMLQSRFFLCRCHFKTIPVMALLCVDRLSTHFIQRTSIDSTTSKF